MEKEFYGAAESEEENAGFGYDTENNVAPTPKGYRDRPGDVALSMGFDAARRIVDRVQVKEMTGRDFADLVVQLGYSFEAVLREQNR